MSIAQVAVVITAGMALASALCWLIYSVANREAGHERDDWQQDGVADREARGHTRWPRV